MVDKLFYKFFAWLDKLDQKIEKILTFDVGQENQKKEKDEEK